MRQREGKGRGGGREGDGTELGSCRRRGWEEGR